MKTNWEHVQKNSRTCRERNTALEGFMHRPRPRNECKNSTWKSTQTTGEGALHTNVGVPARETAGPLPGELRHWQQPLLLFCPALILALETAYTRGTLLRTMQSPAPWTGYSPAHQHTHSGHGCPTEGCVQPIQGMLKHQS